MKHLCLQVARFPEWLRFPESIETISVDKKLRPVELLGKL